MKVLSEDNEFETKGEFDVVDLTGWVEEAVSNSGVIEGVVLVYAGHSTGVLVLNELDSALLEDLKAFMRENIPAGAAYMHPGNAHAHLRSMLFTPSRVIPIHEGHLGLGTWQSLYWIEAERRPRRRKVEVIVMGE
jgi:secondary thiamine-phosphate synthase enzyme